MSHHAAKLIILLISLLVMSLSPVQARPEDSYRVAHFDYPDINALDWSSDAKYLAMVAQSGVYILDSEFKQVDALQIPETTRWMSRDVAWNSTGDWLAASSYDPCWLMVWRRVADEFVLKYQLPACGRLEWDARSDWLAIVGASRPEGSTLIFNVNDADNSMVHVINCPDAQDVAFSPTRPLVACANDDNHMVIWNTASGEMEQDIPGGGRTVDWSVDGSKLLTIVISGKKAMLAPSEGAFTIMVRAYNGVYIYDLDDWTNLETISITDDYTTVWNALWIDDNRFLTDDSAIVADFSSDYASILQRQTGEFSMSFRLGGGSSSGGLNALSPNRKYFSGFTYWRSTWLNIGVLDGTNIQIKPDGIAADWTPDGNYLTAVDADGWLYHYHIPVLIETERRLMQD